MHKRKFSPRIRADRGVKQKVCLPRQMSLAYGERKTNPYKTEGLSPRFWQKKHLCLF